MAAIELGRRFTFTLEQTERVKWYAPHIRHIVLDICCSAASAPATMPAQPVCRAAANPSAGSHLPRHYTCMHKHTLSIDLFS